MESEMMGRGRRASHQYRVDGLQEMGGGKRKHGNYPEEEGKGRCENGRGEEGERCGCRIGMKMRDRG